MLKAGFKLATTQVLLGKSLFRLFDQDLNPTCGRFVCHSFSQGFSPLSLSILTRKHYKPKGGGEIHIFRKTGYSEFYLICGRNWLEVGYGNSSGYLGEPPEGLMTTQQAIATINSDR